MPKQARFYWWWDDYDDYEVSEANAVDYKETLTRLPTYGYSIAMEVKQAKQFHLLYVKDGGVRSGVWLFVFR